MAVGMTFVLINRTGPFRRLDVRADRDPFFGMLFAPSYFDLDVTTAVIACLALGLVIGLINGFLVTVLEVPVFIATLTTLFIGRGVIRAQLRQEHRL